MNNPKQILWTDLNSIPPKNYLWQKEDGIYACVNGNWIKTKSFGSSDECECEEEENEKQCISIDDISGTIAEELIRYIEQNNEITIPRESVVYPDKYIKDNADKEELSDVLDFIRFATFEMSNIVPLYCEEPVNPEKFYIACGLNIVPGNVGGYDIVPTEVNGETLYFMIDSSSRPK